MWTSILKLYDGVVITIEVIDFLWSIESFNAMSMVLKKIFMEKALSLSWPSILLTIISPAESNLFLNNRKSTSSNTVWVIIKPCYNPNSMRIFIVSLGIEPDTNDCSKLRTDPSQHCHSTNMQHTSTASESHC